MISSNVFRRATTLALGLALLAGCEDGGSKTTSTARETSDTPGRHVGRPVNYGQASRRAVPDKSRADTPARPARRGALATKNLKDVAGVGEGKVKLNAADDVLITLYDIGKGSKVGSSKTVIHFFGESSQRYRKLVYNDRGEIPKRLPDDDIRALMDAAERDRFTDMLSPTTAAAVQATVARGEGIITIEQNGQLRGVARPRVRSGGTQEQMELYTGMKLTLLRLAQIVNTPVVTGGKGPGTLRTGIAPSPRRNQR